MENQRRSKEYGLNGFNIIREIISDAVDGRNPANHLGYMKTSRKIMASTINLNWLAGFLNHHQYHPRSWYIYPHGWLSFLMVNVCQYTIHGLFGWEVLNFNEMVKF